MLKFFGLPTLRTEQTVNARSSLLRRLNENNFDQILDTPMSFEESLHLGDGVKYRPGRLSDFSAPCDSNLPPHLHSPFSGAGRTLTGDGTAVPAQNTEPAPATVLWEGKWLGVEDGLVKVEALDGGKYRAYWNHSGTRSTSDHSAEEVSNSITTKTTRSTRSSSSRSSSRSSSSNSNSPATTTPTNPQSPPPHPPPSTTPSPEVAALQQQVQEQKKQLQRVMAQLAGAGAGAGAEFVSESASGE